MLGRVPGLSLGPPAYAIYGHKLSTGTVRHLFYQKSYDSTAPVRRPAGDWKNRLIFLIIFRHRTVPGEV